MPGDYKQEGQETQELQEPSNTFKKIGKCHTGTQHRGHMFMRPLMSTP